MTHILLKTIKPSLNQVKQAQAAEHAPARLQPMVIDFSKHDSSKHYAKPSSHLVFYALLAALGSFLIASVLALFILGDQINHLWREAQHVTAEHVKITTNAAIEPQVAFPATTLTPLPSKALIVGKDFQKLKSSSTKQLDLVPMLEHLPVAKPSRPMPHDYVKVETAHGVTQSISLQQQADNAVAGNHPDKAIDLYMRALRLTPGDETLRSNCVALLLEQARSFDERQDTPHALATYKKAQSLWQGDAQTAHDIKARIDFLEMR